MAAAVEGSIQPDLDQPIEGLFVQNVGRKAKDVGVVMTAAHLGDQFVMTEGSPHAGELVGCDNHSERRSANQDSSLRIADLAFDVNLLVAMKRAGFRLLEVPIEWTDVVGSKVTSSLLRQSLTMFLSVVRVWLIYSPSLYRWLRPLRPLEGWVYKTLRQPQPLPRPEGEGQRLKRKAET